MNRHCVVDASQSVPIILLRLQSSLESLFLGDSFTSSKYSQSPTVFLTRHARAVEAYTVYKQGDRREVTCKMHTQSRKGTAAKRSKNPQSALLQNNPSGTLNVSQYDVYIYLIMVWHSNLMITGGSSPESQLTGTQSCNPPKAATLVRMVPMPPQCQPVPVATPG